MVIEFSSFEFWGHIPHAPARGLRPLDPRLPTLVGLGFVGVLGPTRGGVAKVGNSPPFLNLWGHIPHSTLPGALPPGPQFAHPRRLRVRRGFGSHSWRGC